jgi:hypothetical protein
MVELMKVNRLMLMLLIFLPLTPYFSAVDRIKVELHRNYYGIFSKYSSWTYSSDYCNTS